MPKPTYDRQNGTVTMNGTTYNVDERILSMTDEVAIALFWMVDEIRTATSLASVKTSAQQVLQEFFTQL